MPKKKVEKDNSERWVLTYADVMNLLLILFIVLYSMSQLDQKKYEAMAEGMRESFNGANKTETPTNPPESSTQNYWIKDDNQGQEPPNLPEDARKTEYEKELLKMIADKNLQDKIAVSVDNRGIVLTLKDTFLYKPGSAAISFDAADIIMQIGYILNKIPYRQIIIEGHTDSDPLNKESPFIDNLGLSSARATNVSRLLIRAGLDPSLLSAMGYGEYRPVVKNDTAQNKSKNRRVLITLLRRNMESNQAISVETGSGEV